MEFTRSRQRDERRRRVLMDEMRTPANQDDDLPSVAARESRAPGYAAAARDAEQPRITALVPKRPWTLCVAALLGLVVVVGIQALYSSVWISLSRSQQLGLAALDVTAHGSLVTWFSNVWLLASSALAVMVYHLRRHKVDDYHGRYRCWLWCSAALVLASMDSVTQLHLAVEAALERVAGAPPWGGSSIWWLSTLGTLGWLLGIRMLVEVRRCRPAAALLLMAGGGYATASLVELKAVSLTARQLDAMLASTSLLWGHLLVGLTVAVYARHVYLEAQGLLPMKLERRPSQTKVPSAVSHATSAPEEQAAQADRNGPPTVKRRPTIRVDEAHQGPGAASKPGGEATESHDTDQKLSKAERRRRRKQERRASPDS